MRYLRERHEYTSLKMEYMDMQFPALGAKQSNDNGFGHMVEAEDGATEAPSLDKDTEIEALKKQVSDMNALQQKLVVSEAKCKAERNKARTATLKLKHVEKVATKILFSCQISN